MTTTYTVRRDGQADLRFRGERLGAASSKRHQGPKNTRWEEVELFRTSSGRYVASVAHRTRWENEHDTFRAIVGAGSLELLEELRDEGESADVVDLVKEALNEAGIDASEELEDEDRRSDAELEREAREDGAILYVLAVFREGEPYVTAGANLGGLLEELVDSGHADAIEPIKRVLSSSRIDPELWNGEPHELDDDGEGGKS